MYTKIIKQWTILWYWIQAVNGFSEEIIFYPAHVLFGQANCIDWIIVCYIQCAKLIGTVLRPSLLLFMVSDIIKSKHIVCSGNCIFQKVVIVWWLELQLPMQSVPITTKVVSWNVEVYRYSRAPTTLKSEGEVTSLSGADKREVRDNREKWWEYREKSRYFSNCTTFHIRGALSWHYRGIHML